MAAPDEVLPSSENSLNTVKIIELLVVWREVTRHIRGVLLCRVVMQITLWSPNYSAFATRGAFFRIAVFFFVFRTLFGASDWRDFKELAICSRVQFMDSANRTRCFNCSETKCDFRFVTVAPWLESTADNDKVGSFAVSSRSSLCSNFLLPDFDID